MAIKWTKDDVIKKFQEAMTPEQPKTGDRSRLRQQLEDKARMMRKGKPGEVEEAV